MITNSKSKENILVIKLSALGDFILSLGAMEAIRGYHKDAHITLLTTKPFLEIAERSGYFNDIIIDNRPKFYDIRQWYFLFSKFNAGYFARVYDLQLNDRTGVYYRLFLKKPEWSGVIAGTPLFYANPDWRSLHAFTRHQEILKVAGLDVNLPDISWMQSDTDSFGLKNPYILLIPGSAPLRPEKRWPAIRYAALGLRLIRDGYDVAVIGSKMETDVISSIIKACPRIIDLSEKTSLYDIATLARLAAGAVGNDTGPTHLAALAGCPTVVLFCKKASSPEQSAPVGKSVQCLQADTLESVPVTDVFRKLLPEKAG
ncbi:MAG: glycosyltransferase family 9 protein [Alphaproteobacteria bacterium]|nr:glycosyltransferase family 9 protein [Alphaproteobacteria bacterium]MCK5556271.1 glycosyltransferase family 9 protein [Alphaproteobacteria bacterium]